MKASIYPGVATGVWLLAAFLFFFRIGHHSYWMDELQTAEMIGHCTQSQIWNPSTGSDSEQFLTFGFLVPYYSAAKAWSGVFGTSEAAVRSLSAAGALIALAMILWLGPERWGLGRRASLLSGILFALSPMMLWYAQEARYYGLLQPFALALAWFYLGFWQTRSLRWLVAWSVCSVVSLTIHPFMIFVIVALSIHGVCTCLVRRLRIRLSWVAAHAVVAAVFLAMLWPLWEAHKRIKAHEDYSKVTDELIPWKVMSNFLCGVYEHPFALLALLLLVSATALLVLHTREAWKQMTGGGSEKAPGGDPMLWIAAALGGCLLMAVVSIYRPIMVEGKKYEIIFFAPWCVCMGSALASWRTPRPGVALFVGLLAINTFFTDQLYYFEPQKQNWRLAGYLVRQEGMEGDVWIHQGTWRAFVSEYYAAGGSVRVNDVLWKPPDLERGVPDKVKGARRVWMVKTGGIAEAYEAKLQEAGFKRVQTWVLPSGTAFTTQLWLFDRDGGSGSAKK